MSALETTLNMRYLYVIIFFLITFHTHAQEDLQDFENKGDTFFENEEFELVLQQYEKAVLKVTDETHAIYYKISECYDQLDQSPKSIIALEKGLTTIPTFHKEATRYYNNIAYYHKKLGNRSAALKAYSQAIKIKQHFNEICPKYYGSAAELYVEFGEFAKGTAFYKTALRQYDQHDERNSLKIQKKIATLWLHLGNVSREQKLYKEAIACYQKSQVVYRKNNLNNYTLA